MEQFEAISVGASKEHSLEKAMQKMEDDWDPIVFNTTLYRDTGKLGCKNTATRAKKCSVGKFLCIIHTVAI